ncbi:MAG: hypothetical protein RMA76_24125 [Deltaproteobacteria bacterium]
MRGRAGLEAAADVVARTPERWRVRNSNATDNLRTAVTREAIEAGFGVVGQGLALLGPEDPDERFPKDFTGWLYPCWKALDEAFTDRRGFGASAFRGYLDAQSSPVEAPEGTQISWLGLMRSWLRWDLGALAGEIIRSTPSQRADDPDGLREAAVIGVDRVALLLRDADQVATLDRMMRVADVSDLARRLWHHPNAGPKMKGALDELFSGNYAEILKSDPPEHHDDPPWILD